MSNGDPWDGFFYPILTLMIDSYILLCIHVASIKTRLKNENMITYAQTPLINVHVGVTSRARSLILGLGLHLHPYFVYTRLPSVVW